MRGPLLRQPAASTAASWRPSASSAAGQQLERRTPATRRGSGAGSSPPPGLDQGLDRARRGRRRRAARRPARGRRRCSGSCAPSRAAARRSRAPWSAPCATSPAVARDQRAAEQVPGLALRVAGDAGGLRSRSRTPRRPRGRRPRIVRIVPVQNRIGSTLTLAGRLAPPRARARCGLPGLDGMVEQDLRAAASPFIAIQVAGDVLVGHRVQQGRRLVACRLCLLDRPVERGRHRQRGERGGDQAAVVERPCRRERAPGPAYASPRSPSRRTRPAPFITISSTASGPALVR